MSEISISGRMKVISFQKEFLKSYPFLYPSLRYPDDKPVDENLTIANATIQNLDKKINAIYIDANFHTDIFGSNTFEDTMEKDFYKHLSDAIDLIFGK